MPAKAPIRCWKSCSAAITIEGAIPLEQAIAYIDDDEMVEVTPQSIRSRRAILDPHERKKARRKGE